MKNKRQIARQNSLYHSKVVEVKTGRLIGRTVDISDTGMRLVSDSKPESDGILDLRLELPKPVNGKQVIEFKAAVRWVNEDTNPDYHAVGIELIDPSEDVCTILQILQQNLCFVH
jgi:c-di-GMP-binding flagellar brake protein YcgR